MEIRLLEWRSFPQWIKSTLAFGLAVFCHLTIIWLLPRRQARLSDTLAFAISWPRIQADSALQEKKRALDEREGFQKITTSANFTGVWPIFCLVHTDVNLARPEQILQSNRV
jgi:hypothetical protein